MRATLDETFLFLDERAFLYTVEADERLFLWASRYSAAALMNEWRMPLIGPSILSKAPKRYRFRFVTFELTAPDASRLSSFQNVRA